MSAKRILHYFPLDPASRQVRLAMAEKKLPCEEVIERYYEGRPEFKVLNPSGLTPVLVEERDGDRIVVCEARAILEHLEETEPEPALLPRDPGRRAEARRLMQWFDRKFDFEVNAFLVHEKMEKRLLRLGSPDYAALRQGREGLRQHLDYIEGLAKERPERRPGLDLTVPGLDRGEVAPGHVPEIVDDRQVGRRGDVRQAEAPAGEPVALLGQALDVVEMLAQALAALARLPRGQDLVQ